MNTVSFADVVHQSISFSRTKPAERLILKLIDTAWIQRLRDISQTANTRLVYMFSEHSRFGHSLGVAYLAGRLMARLSQSYARDIRPYAAAVSAAALLHDVGHLAPGSHTAFKTWFPERSDQHEKIATRVILEDPQINSILKKHSRSLPDLVTQILEEDKRLPPWTWEIISGGGWNVDRGNWCIVDSIMAGVSYGRYNIPALTESIILTKDKHLALNESRLDAMMHFALSRHAMYRQLYQHRVLLAADMLNLAIVRRARDLMIQGNMPCADAAMAEVLQSTSPLKLKLETVFAMRESWWKYHLAQWSLGPDKILADLATRLRDRRLFKTVRIQKSERKNSEFKAVISAVKKSGFDPRYYLHQISTVDMHSGDNQQSMHVVLDNGKIQSMRQAEPLFAAMVRTSKQASKSWFALPLEAKLRMGRKR